MALKHSTGRKSPLTHATGTELETRGVVGRSGTVKYSTGEDADVRHSTGVDPKRAKPYKCPICNGTGENPVGVKCNTCKGKGIVISLEEPKK